MQEEAQLCLRLASNLLNVPQFIFLFVFLFFCLGLVFVLVCLGFLSCFGFESAFSFDGLGCLGSGLLLVIVIFWSWSCFTPNLVLRLK